MRALHQQQNKKLHPFQNKVKVKASQLSEKPFIIHFAAANYPWNL
jgi:hypothetical protein